MLQAKTAKAKGEKIKTSSQKIGISTINTRLEDFALWELQRGIDTNLNRGGWSKFIRTLSVDYNYELKEELCCRARFQPDAFIVKFSEKIIQIYEIEDTSKLALSKIENYYWISELLLDMGWRIEIYTTDRYGRNPNLLNIDTVECLFIGRFPRTSHNKDIFEEAKNESTNLRYATREKQQIAPWASEFLAKQEYAKKRRKQIMLAQRQIENEYEGEEDAFE